MELLQTQIAFFINGKISPLESFVLDLRKLFTDSQVQYFPNLPDEASLNIPRLTLSVQEHSLTITVYDSRIDLVFTKEADFDVVTNIATKMSTGGNKMHIKRIGFVKTSFQEVSADNYKDLLLEDKLEGLDVKEFGFHINIRKSVSGYDVNSVEKVNSGNVVRDEVKKDGLIVQRDCNTLNEETLPTNLTPDQVGEIVRALGEETNESILTS